MPFIYPFTKLIKSLAFDEYLRSVFPLTEGQTYNRSELDLQVYTSRELTAEELIELTGYVNAYVDPVEFLTLATTIQDSSKTRLENNTTMETLKTFIHGASFLNLGVFNAFKTIIKYQTTLTKESMPTTAKLTLQLYCETRGFVMKEIEYDIDEIITEWKNGPTLDTYIKYKTVMITDLRSQVTNYDTIMSIKGKISDPNIYFSLNSLQSLYYDIYITEE